jgi:hypothetical protein
MEPAELTAESPALRFRFDSTYANRTALYLYDLETLADAVYPWQFAAHLAALDRGRPTLFRTITYRPLPEDGVNWRAAAVLAVLVPLLVWGARRAYKYRPPAPPLEHATADPELAGLRGWLILLGIGIVLTPFRLLVGTVAVVRRILSIAQWRALTEPEFSSYHPAAAAVLAFEAIFDLASVAYSCALVLVFLGRRRTFRLHYTTLVSATFVVQLADVLAARALHPEHDVAKAVATLTQTFVWGTIWVAYLRLSRRASATFTE